MEMMLVVISFSLCVALAAGYVLGKFRESYHNVIAGLRKEIDELKLSALEKSRNPYMTNCGLEDTNAVLMDIQQTLEYLDVRTNHARKIIGQIRSNPGEYAEDAPNGKNANGRRA